MFKLPNNWRDFQSYIITGGDYAFNNLSEFLRDNGISTATDNPDFISIKTNKALTIDEARELIGKHSIKKITDNPRIFVIRADTINYEAQNSLLKIIEEPSEDNYIFIITGNRHNFLQTILSRVILLNWSKGAENKYIDRARDFISANKKKRLEIVSKLIGDIDDESIGRNDLVEFIEALEINLVLNKGDLGSRIADSLRSLNIAQNYASDRSPSRKMIMEYLAVMI
jgi:DNA polymerase III delta prime subunit